MVVELEDETSNKHKFSTTFSLPGSASPCPPVLGHLAAAPGMCPCHGGSLTWHSCLGTGSHPLHPHCPSVVPGYVHRVSSSPLKHVKWDTAQDQWEPGAGDEMTGVSHRCQLVTNITNQGTPSPQPAWGLYRNEKWIELYFLWGKLELHIIFRVLHLCQEFYNYTMFTMFTVFSFHFNYIIFSLNSRAVVEPMIIHLPWLLQKFGQSLPFLCHLSKRPWYTVF